MSPTAKRANAERRFETPPRVSAKLKIDYQKMAFLKFNSTLSCKKWLWVISISISMPKTSQIPGNYVKKTPSRTPLPHLSDSWQSCLCIFGNFYPYGTVVVKVHSLIVNPKQRVIKFITSFSKEFFILLPCANCFIILKDITDSINQIIVLEKLNIVLKRIRN